MTAARRIRQGVATRRHYSPGKARLCLSKLSRLSLWRAALPAPWRRVATSTNLYFLLSELGHDAASCKSRCCSRKQISEIPKPLQHTDRNRYNALRSGFTRGFVTWLDASNYSKPRLLLHRKPSGTHDRPLCCRQQLCFSFGSRCVPQLVQCCALFHYRVFSALFGCQPKIVQHLCHQSSCSFAGQPLLDQTLNCFRQASLLPEIVNCRSGMACSRQAQPIPPWDQLTLEHCPSPTHS